MRQMKLLRFLTIFAALLLSSIPAYCNVIFAVGSTGSTGGGSSVTFALNNTLRDSSNTVMLIAVHNWPGANISTISYGSHNATFLTSTQTDGNARVSLYYIINPPLGNYNVSVTTSVGDYTIVSAAIYANASGVGNYVASTSQWVTSKSVSISGQNTGDGLVAIAGVRKEFLSNVVYE